MVKNIICVSLKAIKLVENLPAFNKFDYKIIAKIMVRSIKSIYEDLYESEQYLRNISPQYKNYRNKVKNIINTKIESLRLKVEVRDDAKLFLLINFTDLIIIPVIERFSQEPSTIYINEDDFWEDVERDITFILDYAQRQQKRGKNIGEISSHSILNAINSQWNKILTLRIELWGD